ncbi:MAG: DUF4332 domain-containing protein [Litorivicinus sp.]
MTKLTEIEGIGPSYAAKLQAAGIGTQEALLSHCCRPSGRKRLARESGISEKQILAFVNRADLARVRGIGEEYADLLEHCGVDTVKALARRNAQNLVMRMNDLNAQRRLVRAVPSETAVTNWIKQARDLPRGIHY